MHEKEEAEWAVGAEDALGAIEYEIKQYYGRWIEDKE